MSVYIMTHKKFNQPHIDGYKSLLVGAYKGHVFGDFFDDVGDNISEKNSFYCELTGLYWLWKHIDDDYVGIVHYRRYFSKSVNRKKILSEKDIKKKLLKADIIVPNKVNLFKSVENQFAASYKNDPELLVLIRNSVKANYPDYLNAYDKVMKGSEIYFCNMMICSKTLYQQYCSWLFTILFDIEKNVDMTGYSDYQKRLYGFISERLLTVWIAKNRLKVCELGMVNTGSNDGKKKELLKGLRRVYSFYFPDNTTVNRIIDIVRKKQIFND